MPTRGGNSWLICAFRVLQDKSRQDDNKVATPHV